MAFEWNLLEIFLAISRAVVITEVDLDLVLHGLADDFRPVLDRLRSRQAADHFVKWEGLGRGFFVALLQGDDEAAGSIRSFGNNVPFISSSNLSSIQSLI